MQHSWSFFLSWWASLCSHTPIVHMAILAYLNIGKKDIVFNNQVHEPYLYHMA
jgi:hypothetical protein